MLSGAMNLLHVRGKKGRAEERGGKQNRRTCSFSAGILHRGKTSLLKSLCESLTRVIAVNVQGPCTELGHSHDHLNTHRLMCTSRNSLPDHLLKGCMNEVNMKSKLSLFLKTCFWSDSSIHSTGKKLTL